MPEHTIRIQNTSDPRLQLRGVFVYIHISELPFTANRHETAECITPAFSVKPDNIIRLILLPLFSNLFLIFPKGQSYLPAI